MVSVLAFGYILYLFINKAFEVLNKMQEEHRTDQLWFQTFVNENNHQKTDLINKVAENIAQSTAAMETHNKTLERLIDKMDR